MLPNLSSGHEQWLPNEMTLQRPVVMMIAEIEGEGRMCKSWGGERVWELNSDADPREIHRLPASPEASSGNYPSVETLR